MFKRFWWMFFVMLPVGALVGLMLAAVVTYAMPKMYESETTIEVKPRTPGMPPLGENQAGGVPITPQFLGTEMEMIQCRNSLEKVVDSLDLVRRWNVDKETAIRILKGSVIAQNIRGTDLISIRARHNNKEDARDIATEVPNAYKAYRTEIESRDAELYLRELNKEVRTQEDKVEELRKVLLNIKNTKGITDKTDDPEYAEAKRVFVAEQDLLQAMKLKQMGETISGRIPGESVEIHEQPVIADKPVSPNVLLNLTLGAALGLFLSPLMALPVMWALNRQKPVSALREFDSTS
jgi:capsular polysaccharide biosynthesis protein